MITCSAEIDLQADLFDKDREVEQLHLGGGTPTFLSLSQIQDLMTRVKRSFNLVDDDTRDFSIEIDPRTVSEHTLAGLRETGFNRVSLGVQDFDPQVQKAVHRIQSREDTLELVRVARRTGFRSINMDLIYGLPHQSVDSFTRTLEQVIEVKPDRLSVFNYAHLPHMFQPQQRINAQDLPSADEKLRIMDTCVSVLTDAGYQYIGMDHFALPTDELTRARRNHSLYRNFQGYSTHADCDLIGMGVSAIGQVGRCYVQNDKDIDGYYKAVDDGRLAVVRGVELSLDDQLRRDVIRELMCFNSVNVEDMASDYGVSAAEYFEQEKEMLKDLEKRPPDRCVGSVYN